MKTVYPPQTKFAEGGGGYKKSVDDNYPACKKVSMRVVMEFIDKRIMVMS